MLARQASPKGSRINREPKKKPEAPKEPTVIRIVYVYVPIPKEYVDDPILTVKQVMEIMQFGKQKATNLVRDKLKHYWDGGSLRTRKSWLDKWLDDHTEDPSE